MSRANRPLRHRPLQSPSVASRTRGITSVDVDRAADALLRAGERPTIEKVRARIGRGSPNTINPLLDGWWSRLAGRLDAGPAALHRLPEPVLLAAEGLWLQALDDARRRASAEQGSKKTALARDRQELEVRSHVLSIREQEIADRLKQSEGRASRLEIELGALTTLLRKEQASRASTERRLHELQDSRTGGGRAPQPTAAAPGPRATRKPKLRKPASQPARSKPTPRRAVPLRKSR